MIYIWIFKKWESCYQLEHTISHYWLKRKNVSEFCNLQIWLNTLHLIPVIYLSLMVPNFLDLTSKYIWLNGRGGVSALPMRSANRSPDLHVKAEPKPHVFQPRALAITFSLSLDSHPLINITCVFVSLMSFSIVEPGQKPMAVGHRGYVRYKSR